MRRWLFGVVLALAKALYRPGDVEDDFIPDVPDIPEEDDVQAGEERPVNINHLDQPVRLQVDHLVFMGYVRFMAINFANGVATIQLRPNRRSDLDIGEILEEAEGIADAAFHAEDGCST